MKRKLNITIFFLLLCCFFEVNADIEDFELKIHEPVPAEAIMDPIAKKFFRGLTNCLTGWVEIPRQMVLTTSNDGIQNALTVGLFKGTLMTVIRTGIGLYDVGTFFSAAPGDFDSVISPAYVWQEPVETVFWFN